MIKSRQENSQTMTSSKIQKPTKRYNSMKMLNSYDHLNIVKQRYFSLKEINYHILLQKKS